ncbi:MAG: hemolysin family protein, partial [Candidatus Eremiobacterota bacterium]
MEILVELAVLAALVTLNGLFALAEFALVSARKTRLQGLAEAGQRGARRALSLSHRTAEFLATIQIGITLVGILAGAFGGVAIARTLETALASLGLDPGASRWLALALVVTGITLVSVVVGELVPKRLALLAPERIAMAMAGPMLWLSRAAHPLVWVLSRGTHLFLNVLGAKTLPAEDVTEDELLLLFRQGVQSGAVHEEERVLLERVLQLAEVPVRSVMTPRPDVVWLDLEGTPEQAARILASHHHARYPVARGSLDALVGVVRVSDLTPRMLNRDDLGLEQALHPPLVVPAWTRALPMLSRFRQAGTHLAMLVDELGTLQGLVTLNDVLGLLFGDLPFVDHPTEPELVALADGSWSAEAGLSVQQFQRLTGLSGLPDPDRGHTLAGVVMESLGHLPQAG